MLQLNNTWIWQHLLDPVLRSGSKQMMADRAKCSGNTSILGATQPEYAGQTGPGTILKRFVLAF